jgi:putative phosphoesterase
MAAEIGVISDTHGLLREEALTALSGVRMIIHAGDIGLQDIIDRLSAIAPVHAVRGNIDATPWAAGLPSSLTLEVERARIFVIHNVREIDFDPAARGFDAVISGHSHRAGVALHRGVLYLNPGSAGPRRFRLPATLARIAIQDRELRPQILTLTEE